MQTLLAIVALVACAAAIAWGAPRLASRLQRDGRWHPAADGKMRRYIDGQWESRDMTKEEALDYLSSSL